jgi:hypothetical protein
MTLDRDAKWKKHNRLSKNDRKTNDKGRVKDLSGHLFLQPVILFLAHALTSIPICGNQSDKRTRASIYSKNNFKEDTLLCDNPIFSFSFGQSGQMGGIVDLTISWI